MSFKIYNNFQLHVNFCEVVTFSTYVDRTNEGIFRDVAKAHGRDEGGSPAELAHSGPEEVAGEAGQLGSFKFQSPPDAAEAQVLAAGGLRGSRALEVAALRQEVGQSSPVHYYFLFVLLVSFFVRKGLDAVSCNTQTHVFYIHTITLVVFIDRNVYK